MERSVSVSTDRNIRDDLKSVLNIFKARVLSIMPKIPEKFLSEFKWKVRFGFFRPEYSG